MQENYLLEIERAHALLEQCSFSEAYDQIQKLVQYKPVPLKVIALEAQYHLMMENYRQFESCLNSRWKPYYNYDGLLETLDLYKRMHEIYGNGTEEKRYEYIKELIQYMSSGAGEEPESAIYAYKLELDSLCQEFCSKEPGDDILLDQIAALAYIMSDVILYTVIKCYLAMQSKVEAVCNEDSWIKKLPNISYVEERINDNTAFIIVAETENDHSCRAVYKLLKEMKKQVHFVDVPFAEESNENLEQYISEIISYVNGDEADGFAMVLGSGGLLDNLELAPSMQKVLSRFNFELGDIFEGNLSAAWVGDYLKYIEKIYHCDVGQRLELPMRYKYSVVIPFDGAHGKECLSHTLHSCLTVKYSADDYEILISDHSQEEGIEALCAGFGDDRIKYYRTPENLAKSKNVEYAFLQTQGEFILFLDAGDALLPWIFTTLDEVQRLHPNDMLVHWESGYYCSPDVGGGLANQFTISGSYRRGDYGQSYKASSQYINDILTDPYNMYDLPMLNNNSGCRRNYMKQVLAKTGRLWDGIEPDIYMGVVNAAINDNILNIAYPLTIKGMLPLAESNAEMSGADEVGGFSRSMTERLLPLLDTDIAKLYLSLLRAAARGVISQNYLWDIFDWKKFFYNCVLKMDARNLEFDRMIHEARVAASWHGNEFLQWFDEVIFEPIRKPVRIENADIQPKQQGKSYQEIEYIDGRRTVDASRYDVENIFDAVKLFQQFTGL